jgi:glycerol uptake facilitator-like aquaporin
LRNFGRCPPYALVLAASALASASSALAQQLPAPPPNPRPNPGSTGNLIDFILKKSPYEFWLTCLIITFGLAVLVLYIYAIRNIQNRRPEDVSRALIVITVITGSLVLITAGYSNEQIAPAFGLFGTVIGYMLGRMSNVPPATGGNSPEPPAREDK